MCNLKKGILYINMILPMQAKYRYGFVVPGIAMDPVLFISKSKVLPIGSMEWPYQEGTAIVVQN